MEDFICDPLIERPMVKAEPMEYLTESDEEEEEFSKLSNSTNPTKEQSTEVCDNTVNKIRIEKERDPADKKLKALLAVFGLETLLPTLKSQDISYNTLKFLSADDIKDAIQPIGLRAEFREKLFAWRKTHYEKEEETVSVNSKVYAWLKKNLPQTDSATPSKNEPPNNCLNRKLNIQSILKDCATGRKIMQAYKKNSNLENHHREELINLIVNQAIFKDISLFHADFIDILHDICAVFPSEREMQEFYFIPREKNKSTKGKLYAKYFNTRSKRRKINEKLDVTVTDTVIVENNDTDNNKYNGDDTMLIPLKDKLQKSNDDWESVLDMWHKTFPLRRRELTTLDINSILLAWPKYEDAKLYDLINVDYKLLYVDKKSLLFEKWAHFKSGINVYYFKNIHNDNCKKLFTIANILSQKDSVDYLLVVLLNAVLNTRTIDNFGKKKMSIMDSINTFSVHVEDLSEVPQKLQELFSKSHNVDLTIQPFIIAHGTAKYEFQGFYVHFIEKLFPCKSFLEALDFCFKIYQVFALQYPKTCQLPWAFIQNYFYEISSHIKSSNLTAMMHYMKNFSTNSNDN